MPERKKLFLIDAYALIFRGYYAFIKNPRINSKGMNTSAIMGFMNSLLDLIKRESPENLAVAFDKGGSQDRLKIFKEYKANRSETPDAIQIAVPYIFKILNAMQIPVLIKDGYEADDIIGTVAKNAEKNNFEVYMVTPDKDFAQLVSKHIFMYRPARMGNGIEIWGVDEVKKKFEVSNPIQVIDFLGMMGDSVDNIPGLPGVGEKTAKKFISEFGSMENLLKNTEKVKGKLREKIENNVDKGMLSKKLATILLDVPIEYNFESFKSKTPNIDEVKEIFDLLEFKRMNENFLKIYSNSKKNVEEKNSNKDIQYDLFDFPGQTEIKPKNFEKKLKDTSHLYQKIHSSLAKTLFYKKLLNKKFVSVSIKKLENCLAIGFTWSKGKSYYLEINEEIETIKNIFNNKNITMVGYDVKEIIKIVYQFGVKVECNIFDTKISHYLINPDINHDFDLICKTYLNYTPINEKDNGLENFSDLLMEKSDLNLRLKSFLINEMDKSNLLELFTKLEMPLLKVLASMEINGTKINSEFLKNISIKYKDDLNKIEQNIFKISKERFNLASPKQLGEILFEKLKIKDNPKKTKTGQYSTSEEVLSQLSKENEIVSSILEWRSLQKLISTYVDALPKQINKNTKRVHTVFNQAVASTGRLSSANPNLQNIPIRTARGKEIRKAFTCQNDNFKLLSADYSQIELRVIASLSGDNNMISAFKKNEDIHSSTASKVYGVDISRVTNEQRSNAKIVNFGIIYGVSAFGLSNQSNLSRSEAKNMIESYFDAYPTLKNYISNQINFARENGYVETVLGRRRYLRDINARNPIVRGAAERNAVNAPVQGSAADIIKIAMVNIFKKMSSENLKSKMLIQVHDELVFEIHNLEIEKMKKLISDEMQTAFKLKVPLTVDMGMGNNWFDAH